MSRLQLDAPLTLSLAVAIGLACLLLARALRVPGIVILLVVGAIVGPDGVGLIDPGVLGPHLSSLAGAAVAIILFEGGLNLQFRALWRYQMVIRRLVTTGAVFTCLGATLLARFFLAWDWNFCILFGTLVIVTGPTVVSPLLKRIRVRRDLQTILLAESVLIDPIGALIAVIAFDVVINASANGAAIGLVDLAIRLGFGFAIGASGGLLLSWVLRRPHLVPDDYVNIVTLGVVLLLFQGSNVFFHESGIMAVTVAGIVVGNAKLPTRRTMLEFKEQLSHLLIGLLFILLTASIRLSDVVALGWHGIMTVLGIMFVVRPIVVLWSSRGSKLSWRSKAFMSWLAPRGIVAAAVASIFAARLAAIGIEGGGKLQAMVFLVIASTVLTQGLTADFLAGILKVRLPRDHGYVLIGASAFARTIGRLLSDSEAEITVIDKNAQECAAAERDGFVVVFGNAMESKTMRRARVGMRKAVIALTENAAVNLESLRKAHHISRTTTLLLAQRSGDVDEHTLRDISAEQAFGGCIDIDYWNRLLESGKAEGVSLSFVATSEPSPESKLPWQEFPSEIVPLVFKSDGLTQPFSALAFAKAKPTEVTFLVRTPMRTDLTPALTTCGFSATVGAST